MSRDAFRPITRKQKYVLYELIVGTINEPPELVYDDISGKLRPGP